jgi:hypothetical protein
VEYLDFFGTRFEAYKHSIRGSVHTVTILHGLSSNFSKIYYGVLKNLLMLAKITPIEDLGDIGDEGFSIAFEAKDKSPSDRHQPIKVH